MKTTGLLSVLAAFTSSLCCTAPLLALGGMAGSIGWMETVRPYTIAISIGALGWAWYSRLKPATKDTCGCAPIKPTFWQTKAFLGVMTVMAVLLLAFPAYSNWFDQDKNHTAQQSAKAAQQVAYVTIKGMTCTGCEHHVKSEIGKLKGISETKVSYQQGSAVVKYDPKQTSTSDIKRAVNATGYQVIGVKTN